MCEEWSAAVASASRWKRATSDGRLDRRLDAEQLGPDQLDRHRPGEHAVPRAPDLAHAAVVELLDELVAAELLQAADHDRREHGEAGGEVALERVQAEHVERRGRVAERPAHEVGERPGRRRGQPGDERPARRRGHEQREDHDPHAQPGDRGERHVRAQGLQVIAQRDRERHRDLVAEAHAQEPGRYEASRVSEPDHRRGQRRP